MFIGLAKLFYPFHFIFSFLHSLFYFQENNVITHNGWKKIYVYYKMTYKVFTENGEEFTLHKGVKIMQTQKGGSSEYKCSLCSYASSQRGNAVRHIDRLHLDCICNVMEGGMTTPEAIAINEKRVRRIAELEAARARQEEIQRESANMSDELKAPSPIKVIKQDEEINRIDTIPSAKQEEINRIDTIPSAKQEGINRIDTIPSAKQEEINRIDTIPSAKQEEINRIDTIPSPQYSMNFENPTQPPVEVLPSPVFKMENGNEITQKVADIKDKVCEKEMKQKMKELKKLMAIKIKTEVNDRLKNELEKKKSQIEMKLKKQMEMKLQKAKDACAKDDHKSIVEVEKMKEQFASEIKTLSDKVEEGIDNCNEDMLLELQNEIQETGDKFAGLMINFQRMAEKEQRKKAVDKIMNKKGGTRKRVKFTAIEKHNFLLDAGMKKGEYKKVNKTANKMYKRFTKINRKTPKHRN
jgi:hypothetical protein